MEARRLAARVGGVGILPWVVLVMPARLPLLSVVTVGRALLVRRRAAVLAAVAVAADGVFTTGGSLALTAVFRAGPAVAGGFAVLVVARLG